MTTETYREAEIRRLNTMLNFRLPNYFFRLGIFLFLAAFLTLLIFKMGNMDMSVIKPVARKLMLLSLLFCSLARDKVEDEMTIELRSKSYSLAFIFGVLFAILSPYIDYLLDFILKSDNALVKEAEIFPVLIFMLSIQVLFYRAFKGML